jgi:hypothetical protein
MIVDAGGICIAAHANSTHGVAMLGLDFGGQTRIAYTQDRNLHALEVTDLNKRTRNTTQRFFSGTKPEYPRRMRCIQGSDAHRLNALPSEKGKPERLGVGDRVTDFNLPERSFAALRELFISSDFSRSKPYNASLKPFDYVQTAREEGASVVQSFHESVTRRGGRMYGIIADVCAFANTNGGVIYVGASADPKAEPLGVPKAQETIDMLRAEISRMISPTLDVEIDTLDSQGKTIVRLQVPSGTERPYAIEDYKIYVRDDSETSLAVRDEIVSLVLRGERLAGDSAPREETPPAPPPAEAAPRKQLSVALQVSTPPNGSDEVQPPQGGVEVIGTEQRNDTQYHVVRDLRNGNVVKNVTRSSARRLWHYAISQRESNPVKADKVQWQGDIGLWRRYQKGGETRYDLVQRSKDGRLRVYYGVTDSGMHGPWQAFLGPDEEE